MQQLSVVVILSAMLAVWHSAPVRAGFEQMYNNEELQTDAKRLETAVRKIYKLGIEPILTAEERRGLGRIDFQFPMPRAGDDLMNFYAYHDGKKSVIVMPILSLKSLEDLMTARAYVQKKNLSHGTIDIYYAMLRHRPIFKFKNARYPDILTAMGIPKNAHEEKAVGDASLRMRNDAFAFIMVHELGHALFRHKGYDEITKQQARDDEIQSDRFALDVLNRAGSTPFGAFLFFQAQIYRFRHRSEFKTNGAWTDYLKTVATHPMSVDRLRAFGNYTAKTVAEKRSSERVIWTFVGAGMTQMADYLTDELMQECIAAVAKASPLSILVPTPMTEGVGARLLVNECDKAFKKGY